MKRQLFILALLAFTSAAFGHAFVDHATPKVGETVTEPPTQIQIVFTEALNESASGIEVYDGTGKQIDKKDSHLDAKDKTLLIVSLNQVLPGTYKVVWHVTAVDTHKTHGDFEFTYKPKN